MATATPIRETNVLESEIGGITVRGRPRSLSAWFVLALLCDRYVRVESGVKGYETRRVRRSRRSIETLFRTAVEQDV